MPSARIEPRALSGRASPPLLAIVFVVFTVLAAVPCASAQQRATQDPTARQLAWQEDLHALDSALKAGGFRIAAGIASRGQKDVADVYPHLDADIDALIADVPKLTDPEVLLRLMQLVAGAHIAHNVVRIPLDMGFVARLPLGFYWFADGLTVTYATPEYTNLLGARVVSIGGKTPEQALADLAPYISHENDVWLRFRAPEFLPAKGVLQHLQMIGPDGLVPVQLETIHGERMDLRLPVPLKNPPMIGMIEGLHLATPLARTGGQSLYYWYRYLPDSQTLYIQYRACANDPKEHLGEFTQRLLADADTHTVKRVVIDLRDNGGGDSSVINPLKGALAAHRKSLGPVYVLTGPATFSSAVMNAEELRRDLSATLVGEPTGGMPGGYGEVNIVTLPHSKLVVQFTTKHWGAKQNEPLTLTPDIPVPERRDDLLAGADAALDTVLHLDSPPHPAR